MSAGPSSYARVTLLRIEETEQHFFVVLAERGADAHVAADGSRNAGRKGVGSVVTARAILLKNTRAFIFMLLRMMGRGVLDRLGAG